MQRKYEIAFLLRESEYTAAVERIKSALEKVSAGLQSEDTKMGVRELAYILIKNREKFRRAFYYFVKIEATPEQIRNFEQETKYDQGILRHMIVAE